jgi:GrpB-like predicted nucleotidyltransferase (UPF0157 family)
MWSADLPTVEESVVSVVPHDREWSHTYAREAGNIEAVFGRRCSAVEHFGSTAVPGLLAKPIVDILVASVDGAAPSFGELEALGVLSYTFLGEDERRSGRWFWRKRVGVSFNLSLVPLMSDLWCDNLLVRDYLRSHPLEVEQYADIKRRAVQASPNSLRGYQDYKREFMQGLKARAIEWRRRG